MQVITYCPHVKRPKKHLPEPEQKNLVLAQGFWPQVLSRKAVFITLFPLNVSILEVILARPPESLIVLHVTHIEHALFDTPHLKQRSLYYVKFKTG
jgi:hypothetical protein